MRLRRLMLLAGAAALAVVVAVSGQAGRAAPSPSLTVDAPIVELQADAGRVIFRTLSDAATCRELVVWSPSTGARVALPGSGSGCANYGGYGGVALAGGTAAWVPELNGNNTAETYLYLASLDSKRPHPEESDSASADGYGAGTVISNLRGGDGFIAYNRSERCSTDNPDFPPQLVCPPGYDSGEAVSDEISLAAPSPRVIATSDHNLTQLAVGGGRVVARAHGGAVVVLAPTRRPAPLVRRAGYKAERPIASYAYLPERALTVATDGHTLAVLHGTTLDVIPLPGRSEPVRAARFHRPPASCASPTSTARSRSTSTATPSTCSTSPQAGASDSRPRRDVTSRQRPTRARRPLHRRWTDLSFTPRAAVNRRFHS
jgi:hypothetical protein